MLLSKLAAKNGLNRRKNHRRRRLRMRSLRLRLPPRQKKTAPLYARGANAAGALLIGFSQTLLGGTAALTRDGSTHGWRFELERGVLGLYVCVSCRRLSSPIQHLVSPGSHAIDTIGRRFKRDDAPQTAEDAEPDDAKQSSAAASGSNTGSDPAGGRTP